MGGSYNQINYASNSNNIFSGYSNVIQCNSSNNSVISGNNNKICCYTNNSTSIGGSFNTLTCYSSSSTIVGGCYNSINECSNYSSIISSVCSTIESSCRSVILGGSNLTLTSENDVVMVPKLISNDSILTGTISNSSRINWKLGSTVSSIGLSMDVTQYIEVSLDGVTYKLALIQ